MRIAVATQHELATMITIVVIITRTNIGEVMRQQGKVLVNEKRAQDAMRGQKM